jgi:hypothetical protein
VGEVVKVSKMISCTRLSERTRCPVEEDVLFEKPFCKGKPSCRNKPSWVLQSVLGPKTVLGQFFKQRFGIEAWRSDSCHFETETPRPDLSCSELDFSSTFVTMQLQLVTIMIATD